MIDDYINKLEHHVRELETSISELRGRIAAKEEETREIEADQTAIAINALRTLMQRELIKKDERIRELENKYNELLLSLARKHHDLIQHDTEQNIMGIQIHTRALKQ
jgi:hypothetical protein